MAERFIQELDELRDLILEMGDTVESQINQAIDSLFTTDTGLAKTVVENDTDVNNFEIKVDEKCERIIALSQPVASDLRLLIASFKMSTDLERIADQAKNIAGQVLNLTPVAVSILQKLQLDVMTEFVLLMVKEALDAFVYNDAAQAKSVCIMDDEVDAMNTAMMHKLCETRCFDLSPRQRIQLVTISKSLERIGDLSTNIAEDVIFLVKAKVIKHHHEEFA